MEDYKKIEKYFKKIIQNPAKWIPEDIVSVDLSLLSDLNLLSFHPKTRKELELLPTFHVVQTEEKITLIHPEFIVWIVPIEESDIPTTYIFIARNSEKPHLEMAYITSGVYNNSPMILRILEKYILQIQENEDFIGRLEAQ